MIRLEKAKSPFTPDQISLLKRSLTATYNSHEQIINSSYRGKERVLEWVEENSHLIEERAKIVKIMRILEEEEDAPRDDKSPRQR